MGKEQKKTVLYQCGVGMCPQVILYECVLGACPQATLYECGPAGCPKAELKGEVVVIEHPSEPEKGRIEMTKEEWNALIANAKPVVMG